MTEPLIALRGLEGNAPTQMTDVQFALLPHFELFQFIWWTVFAGMLSYMALRYVVAPLVRGAREN